MGRVAPRRRGGRPDIRSPAHPRRSHCADPRAGLPRSRSVAEQTVLVVDDEPRIVEFLSENLTADDYAVLSASNGEEALEVLGRTRPDVLLLDVVLPGISGYEVCRRVRDADRVNDPWDPGIPIIMLSAKAESTDRVRGLQRGADDYVTKPFASLFAAWLCRKPM